MNRFSSRRLDNIKRNHEVLTELGAVAQAEAIHRSSHPDRVTSGTKDARATKRRRVQKPTASAVPTRTSARIASAPVRPDYDDDRGTTDAGAGTKAPSRKAGKKGRATKSRGQPDDDSGSPDAIQDDLTGDITALEASWSSWTPTEPPPDRDETGVLHFASHPGFTPNKTPAEVLREGAFGGSYFRPLYSKKLRTTVSGDHAELPAAWTAGLDAARYLTAPGYDADANKFKVACGQSIEEWEAAGWIDHRFDARGWFQWYCRFYRGRRCADDDRQVGRWRRCVGETGRWRRMLLKKYVAAGVREVWDDGADEDAPEVSPVMHQTCHHWAFEVTQDVLDEYWRTGR
ncbi:hypothetical protein KVR01_004825 [Diaporthe batatas]|uniref:uncharacterized protein n=1 Tax=Diaporthe batatas TaxID=748121 RepID=UPI001D05631B|nr:uncharacterized protein KVR01_004825 [Diaporthe batatas]KAG8166273.1 hypothetical protein KVR01_004825 [Diaporthe batatas]